MKCPRCQSELSTQTRESVAVESCSSCSGIWTGTEQILIMVKNHETSFSPELIQKTLSQSGPEIPPKEKLNVLACPVCAKDLYAINYNYSSGVIVNACPGGHGIWFDRGELEGIEIFMEHWDEEKTTHRSEYLSSMAAASREGTAVREAIDERILKDVSPWGFLGAVLHTFKKLSFLKSRKI